MWTTVIFMFLMAWSRLALAQSQVCGTVYVWRNSNLTCPTRAVCADVFNTIRDWYNGTTCHETRILHNCMCESGACPINDENHMMHATQTHRIYTCQPVCTLPWCLNVPSTNNYGPVSMTTETSPAAFNGLTFQRMACRCPRHHAPSYGNGAPHESVRSVGHIGAGRNRQSRHACQNSPAERLMIDPCVA